MSTDALYIDPVTIRTVRQVGGTSVEIADDVQGVARSLRDIDDRFRLRADLDHLQRLVGFTVELHTPQPDGSVEEHFVGAYRELDHRVLRDARRYTAPGYDLAAELERVEDERDRTFDHEQRERTGEAAERLAHAVRTDLGERKHF